MTEANSRVADHPIDPVFLRRWSPRSLLPEPITPAELHTLFEAARWAPSSYNSQPWRFAWSIRGSQSWDNFVGLLNEYNRSWAGNAGALVVVASKQTMLPPGKDREIPSHSHSFDAGAAWGYLALQAAMSGLVTHAMVGFDMDSAFAKLGLPAGHRVEAMIAVGRQGAAGALPEAMRAREAPNGRNAVESFATEGRFKPEE
ncbi:MAG: nitroreductase family protein [Gluconacetobacter diazotrophicus]|nr:nitroreductase family protein [Gluconacetobacter diazotrophicus]